MTPLEYLLQSILDTLQRPIMLPKNLTGKTRHRTLACTEGTGCHGPLAKWRTARDLPELDWRTARDGA